MAAGTHELEARDISKQLFLGEHPHRLCSERAQKRELLRRELYPCTIERHVT
jgi:hypothetical protein